MKKSSRILITGANGLLGSYILRILIQSGYEKLSITKRKDSRLDLIEDLLDKVKVENTDINDIIGMESAIRSSDIVIHAAAIVSFDPRDVKSMMKSNVEGTTTVVNLCLEHQVKKLIFISSVAALGRNKSKIEIDELSKWTNDKLNSQYAISKYLAEQEIWRAHTEGLKVSIINPSIILGAGYWDEGSASIIQNVFNGLPMYPPGSTGLVDVRDVAAFCLKLVENDYSGERFICSGINMTYKELFKKVAGALKVTPPKRPLSTWLASIAWRYIWIKSRIIGKRATVSKESMLNSFQNFKYLNAKSIGTGFIYRDIDQSIEDTCREFLRSNEAGQSFGIIQ